YLLKKENKLQETGFKEILGETSSDIEGYAGLLARKQELKLRLDSLHTKLDSISGMLDLTYTNQRDYNGLHAPSADMEEAGKNRELAAEDKVPSLNMGKGE